jgi:glycerol-3-phosphate dehydrogenase
VTGFALATFMSKIKRETGVSGPRLKVLFERYGTRAEEVARYIGDGRHIINEKHIEEYDPSFKHTPDWSYREVGFLAMHEKVVHLDDLLIRRSTLAWLGGLSRAALDEFADALGEALDWNESQKQAEVTRTLQILADRHGVRFDS